MSNTDQRREPPEPCFMIEGTWALDDELTSQEKIATINDTPEVTNEN